MAIKQCKCGTSFPQYNTVENKCAKCRVEASRKKTSYFSRPKTTIRKKAPSTKHVKIYNDAFGYKKGDFRDSDHERMQQLDFVVGINVNLSSQHPRYDICDHLQGAYPKGFKFYGWHTGCLCFKTTRLLPKKEFIQYLNGGAIKQSRLIKGIPNEATKHINEISDRIKGWKNEPYFIRDNFNPTVKGYKLKVI